MLSGRNYTQYNAWLQHGAEKPISPLHIKGPVEAAFAINELTLGLKRLFGNDIIQEQSDFCIELIVSGHLAPEAYQLLSVDKGLQIIAADHAGLLYGVYWLLTSLQAGEQPSSLNILSAPAVQRRILNHWDNIDGTIERGYSGKSIFFRDGHLNYSPKRIRDYARLLASVGINQIAINNVNVTHQSAKLITEEMLPKLKELAAIFRPYHIQLVVSIHFESPVLLGGLPTADPKDERVAAWWQEAATRVYRYIPDFGGFLVKADSEFRGGPAALGRSQADGANVIAKALAPHNGILYWRCFIYNCMQDWRDTKTDRPKAAYDTFMPLDGKFDENVILQVKYGPTDFQVREPNSPLLGAMKKTRQAIEFQVTQEYTGQQIDLYALAPQWQEIFEAPVSDTCNTKSLIGNRNRIDTIAAVSNVGDDENWTGHTLAQANLYAFGRMAWDPGLTARQVTEEWVRLTFGNDPALIKAISGMMLASRLTYEKYNAPLGIGWMVAINSHYGPSVDGYEYMKWGTYHRADHKAIGIDRTESGTGYTAQYHPYLNALYSSKDTCPEELLLFFHRLPYDYKLKSGKTLLQHIYDTHFEGVAEVEGFIDTWASLKDKLPESVWSSVSARLARQLENAREWRDVVNTYFFRKTGIPDAKGRQIFP